MQPAGARQGSQATTANHSGSRMGRPPFVPADCRGHTARSPRGGATVLPGPRAAGAGTPGAARSRPPAGRPWSGSLPPGGPGAALVVLGTAPDGIARVRDPARPGDGTGPDRPGVLARDRRSPRKHLPHAARCDGGLGRGAGRPVPPNVAGSWAAAAPGGPHPQPHRGRKKPSGALSTQCSGRRGLRGTRRLSGAYGRPGGHQGRRASP